MGKIYDYVILGGGIGGLAMGSLLATKGKSVCLIEANEKLGGHAYTMEVGKYKFSHDIHYIMGCQEEGPVNIFLKKIGLDSKIKFNSLSSEAYDTIVVRGERIEVPLGMDNYSEVLVKKYPEYERELRKYFEIEKKMIKESRNHNGVLNKLVILKAPWKYVTILKYWNWTLGEIFDKFSFPEEIRAILAGRVGNLSASPREVSFPIYASMDVSYSESASYPKKGVHYFIEEIGKIISSKKNCKIFRRTRVEKIKMKDGRIESVKTDRGEIKGKSFISNLDPAETFKMIVGGNIPKRYRRKLCYKYSDSAICIYLGLKGIDLKKIFKRGNIWHHTDLNLDREYFREIEKNDFSKPWLFISIPSLYADPGVLCPSGCATFEILTFANYDYFKSLFEEDEKKYKRRVKKIYNQILDVIDKNYLHDIRKYIEESIVHTPLDMGRIIHMPKGNVYGSRLTPEWLGKNRLEGATPVDNLYLVGASSSFPGIMGVIKGVLPLFEKLES